jgi:hypothetical protein
VTLSVLAVLVAGAAYAWDRTPVATVLGVSAGPPCTLSVGDETRELTRAEAMTLTTVAGVGQRIGASLNGVAAALDAAVAGGQTLGPEAARTVYRRLPDRAAPTAGSVALARAVLGYDGAALSCAVPFADVENGLPGELPGPLGLTPRADAVRLAMREVFGKQNLGGFAPRGVSTGHIDGSAHYEGRAVDVFFRPVTPENRRAGWLQAHWLLAHADRLHVATVIFDGRVWSAYRSVAGWRDYRHPDGPTDNPVLMHRDHVHVDVPQGG